MPKQAKKDTASMSFEDAVRQNKKQAKREAKLMLKLSEAKAEVQKAEKKLAKAQAQLETDRDNLRKVEESLNDLRQPDQPNKDKSRGETESASEQEHPEGVIFTTNQPEAGTEIETKIVNEILEGIFQTSTSTETTDQPQEHTALKDYQS